MDARAGKIVGMLLTALAAAGCGGGSAEEPQNVAPADVIGTWGSPIASPANAFSACAYVATFDAAGTYEAGRRCTDATSHVVDFERERGAYTIAPSGRINFFPSGGWCTREAWVLYANYSKTAYQQMIGLTPPLETQHLVPSMPPAFPDDGTQGCFSADWTFTPVNP